jgi:hypothetical protein
MRNVCITIRIHSNARDFYFWSGAKQQSIIGERRRCDLLQIEGFPCDGWVGTATRAV